MTMSKSIGAFIIIIILSGLGFLVYNTSSSESIDVELLNNGIQVYRANYCGSCHTLEIANTRGMFAPNHDTIVQNSADYIAANVYVGNADSVEAYIYESIVNPTIFYTPGYEASNHHMPAFTHLSDEELTAMVYMLMNQEDYVGTE